MLTTTQTEQLLKGVNPSRVKILDGLSHMEAFDIRAHLIRIFGFANWDTRITETVLIYEDFGKNSRGRDSVNVAYRVGIELTVRDEDGNKLARYGDVATGESRGMPATKRGDAHDMAMKTASSQALKRCAINLGDQFGLSLYNQGSTQPFVRGTLVAVASDKAEAPEVEVKGSEQLRETEITESTTPSSTSVSAAESFEEADTEVQAQWHAAVEQAETIEALRKMWGDINNAPAGLQAELRELIPARAKELAA
ncbi:Rad52/Rad22 family DNA repair protein [Dermabacter vaginalis]|uniref:DNA repair protein Rad52 n=1 Tax=Dermabacter vaginalis TaxID=1630135 RepID=A0ABX6A3D0_9MICO|nr:Rad52/Rad22 family DNA repair protein [Dermabacter vaginalis]QEU11613.1 hypothetical protein FOB48_04445 [Dermabacter vaginalis]